MTREHSHSCAGCEGHLDDWTPGCMTCRERRRLRARRSGDPAQLAAYHAQAALNWAATVQDNARRMRDGETVHSLPERGYRGRWVAA